MIDITPKSSTLRKAVAIAELKVSRAETIEAIEQRRVAKGDVFEFSRAAGLLAVKKTSDVIPDCHPLPIEFTAIRHKIEGLTITVTVEVHTIYKTGVEVEAMHGAAITALTMYDMLKPIDKGIEIGGVRLLEKAGGKSGLAAFAGDLRCGVVVCSDTISRGEKEDASGRSIVASLEGYGIAAAAYEIVADEIDAIRRITRQKQEAGFDLLLFTGGTGLSPRDVTPDALRPLIEREIPGLMETARRYGQDRMPYAMLSRGIAGFIGEMLVIVMPGSKKGAEETMAALFPQVLHVFKVKEGARHEEAPAAQRG